MTDFKFHLSQVSSTETDIFLTNLLTLRAESHLLKSERIVSSSWWRHQMETFSALLVWSFVRGIHRSPVNSPHKGQWRGALMFSFTRACINGDLRRQQAHYDVTVMYNRFLDLFQEELFEKIAPSIASWGIDTSSRATKEDIEAEKRLPKTILPCLITMCGSGVGFIRVNLAWISNHLPSKEWDELTFPFLNFIGTWIWGENLIKG